MQLERQKSCSLLLFSLLNRFSSRFFYVNALEELRILSLSDTKSLIVSSADKAEFKDNRRKLLKIHFWQNHK